jgi:transposase
MKNKDARSQNQETQYVLRKQLIKLRKKGFSNKEATEIVGISASHGSTIWQRYLRGGNKAIKPGIRGRKEGAKRTLSQAQEAEVQEFLVDKNPMQLKLPFALWTRDAVRILIKKLFKIEMPIRSVGEYLRRWNFTPQKPTKRAYEQDPKKLKNFLDVEYPEILKAAKKEKAEIHWGDETGINSSEYNVKGYAPKGKTPILRLTTKRNKINMISSITNQGKVRFMLYRETMTSKVLIKFLSRLIKDAKQKIFMILDNLRVHHSNAVRDWLKTKKDKIRVFFLPPYSPEINPDEYLNSNLKQKIRSGIPAKTVDDLQRKTRSFMTTIQHRPEHVKNYFKHPKCCYAGII